MAQVKPQILLVDDNKNACNLLSLVLTQRGFSVRQAHEGATGLEMVTEHSPDVAIIDIGMPVMNGIELVKKIKLQQDCKTICVALTGNVADNARQEALDAGFEEHFLKPVRPSTIAKFVSQRFPATEVVASTKTDEPNA